MSTLPSSPEPVATGLRWQNRFHQLGADFYTELAPQPLGRPYWVGRSPAVAALLELDPALLQSDELLQALSGNRPLRGSAPLASVYSGHQFGQWAGQLGDGRAILLGEANGLELQLKGSGLTPYSRMGDGRAVLRSSIREFLASEAMAGLGIASTRALAVTGSDDPVWREQPETAAVVTRVAPSFIRFGHFEHFAARGQWAQLQQLADFVLRHFYPDCQQTEGLQGNAYAQLLQAVSERTAQLLAQWQAVGFCHGVMNTDNMSMLGLTLDYGPFQFLDAFDPDHICNHSDRAGRYAFARQPDVAHWNLFCLAQALLPLIGDRELALQVLDGYPSRFEAHYLHQMCAKLGLREAGNDAQPVDAADAALVQDLLALLARDRVDYTVFWRRLSHYPTRGDAAPLHALLLHRADLDAWLGRFDARRQTLKPHQHAQRMQRVNPKFVLRNYLAQQAIEAARDKDFSGVARLQQLLAEPFDEHPDFESDAALPPAWASQIEISCSS